jgi:hypothetical protein
MSEAELANTQPPDSTGTEQQETTAATSFPKDGQAKQSDSYISSNELLPPSSGSSVHPPSQQNQQAAESLPNSAGSGPTASQNLPSIQTIDGHRPQSQPSAQPIQAPAGSPLPSHMPHMPHMPPIDRYIPGYPPGMPQMGISSNPQGRYHIPGDPSKMLSGSRHKKEIKRRTKTGCLTCRKRRIKVWACMLGFVRGVAVRRQGRYELSLSWGSALKLESPCFTPSSHLYPTTQYPTLSPYLVNINIFLMADKRLICFSV